SINRLYFSANAVRGVTVSCRRKASNSEANWEATPTGARPICASSAISNTSDIMRINSFGKVFQVPPLQRNILPRIPDSADAYFTRPKRMLVDLPAQAGREPCTPGLADARQLLQFLFKAHGIIGRRVIAIPVPIRSHSGKIGKEIESRAGQ